MNGESLNPWTILSQKEVYDNPWINVTEFDVINPNGGKGIYGKVHFKGIAVGILVLDENNNTYLVGQYRFPINEYSWEIPEGGGDPKIPAVESAQRELLEETGLVAKEWTELLRMHLSNSITDELAIIFMARDLEQNIPIPEETEELKIKKMPFEEAYQLVKNGRITDSMSVAAIQKMKLLILESQ
jgi:8-oxo-dGTP pyrophosphatase MutT (NUDIX family)